MKCTVCHAQYLAISAYIQHVQMAHQGTLISCCWCLKTIKKMSLASHLLTHYIGTYECLYCDFACNVKLMMLRHLCNVHGSKPLFCSKRREGMNLKDPQKNYHLDLRSTVRSSYIEPLKYTMQAAPNFVRNFKRNYLKTTSDESKNEPSVKTASLPKIANVQGGIHLSQDGEIVAAQETLSMRPTTNKSISKFNKESTVVSVKRHSISSDSLPSGKRIKLTKAENGSLMMIFSANKDVSITKTVNRTTPPIGTMNNNVEIVKCTPDITYNEPIANCTAPQSTSKSSNANTTKEVTDTNKLSQVSPVNASRHMNDFLDSKLQTVTFVSEPTVKHIKFHLAEFCDIIDNYYTSLITIVNKKLIPPTLINVCGFAGCEERFPAFDKLKYHMRLVHRVMTLESAVSITCSHCKLHLVSINAYISHLTVHSLNRYVCFLCCFTHFLPTIIVKHMSEEHFCKSVQLSYVHPKKLDLLCDLIAIMPGQIQYEEKRKYILKTIAMASAKRPTELVAEKSTHPPGPIVPIGCPSPVPVIPDKCPFRKSLRNVKYPKQVHYSNLYKCGLCLTVESSRLSFQKHLTECPNQESNYYFCAFCDRRFKDWLAVPEHIFQHLYFHGENLYGCGDCSYYHYLFESVATHIKKWHSSQSSEINVLRETMEHWECNVCQLRTPLRQHIMEHMQNVHDLPGERFMCSLCKFRTFTNAESLQHFKDSHQNQNVVMIEMYHLEKENVSNDDETDTDSSDGLEIIEDANIDTVSISSSSDQSIDLATMLMDTVRVKREKSEESEKETNSPCNEARSNARSNLCEVLQEHSYSNIFDGSEKSTIDDASIAHPSLEENSAVPSENAIDNPSDQASVENPNSESVESSNVRIERSRSSKSPMQEESVRESNPELSVRQDLSPTAYTERRASRRVAVKKDATSRWSDCIKLGCLFCSDSFVHYKSLHMHSRIVHGLQSKNYLLTKTADPNETGSFTGFRLLSLVRCFYCEKHDIHSALRMHCETKHASKTFICLDYWNTFKCGLCAYRNGSGNEKEFSSHFQHFHNNVGHNDIPYDHIDDTFVEWALSIGKKGNVEGKREAKIIKYICGLCPEQTVEELDMGVHVAVHALTFKCPHCKEVFKHLKVCYEHVLTIHRDDSLIVPSSCPMSYDQVLLDVKMCFINGLILSKREAQFTSHGSLQELENGLQKYYEKQIADLHEYKASLALPVSGTSEVTPDITCKSFIMNLGLYPIVKVERTDNTACQEE
uniref:C2H2-type domain-containing protein n=1 Tax=Anopheles farauti TaxID=69004 RepID=A0A182QBA1_9DIPT